MDAVKSSTKILCDNFIDFAKLIFILSHGNVTVERDFFVNVEYLVKNQLNKSFNAQQHIYDTVKDVEDIESIKIDKNLLYTLCAMNIRIIKSFWQNSVRRRNS